MQDSVGGQRAGTFREYHTLDADLVRDRRRMKSGRAAEGDEGELPRIETLLEQRQTNRCPQTGIGHGEQPLRRSLDGEIERVGDVGGDRGPGGAAVEPHLATEEIIAIE